MKHESVRLSGDELLRRMEPYLLGNLHGHLECPGMPAVDAFDAVAGMEGEVADEAYDRLWEQARDAVRAVDWVVSWPDHVVNPRFNGDANYRWVERGKK